MLIVHRISVNTSSVIQAELKAFGISVPSRGFVSFDVAETDVNWPSIAEWIRMRKPTDIAQSKFTELEVEGADWLEMIADWHHGYPEPDSDNFGFLAVTYDISNYCSECGIGLVQKAPFQMKAEPKWGNNSLLQLHWVFDEFFVRPEVWRERLAPLGIESKEVLNRNQEPLKTVLQLIVDQQVDIDVSGLEAVECQRCHRIKYLPNTGGYFPALRSLPLMPLVKSSCYFGSGHSAWRKVLISKHLRRALVALKGFSVRPSLQLPAG